MECFYDVYCLLVFVIFVCFVIDEEFFFYFDMILKILLLLKVVVNKEKIESDFIMVDCY